jgi:hypothetical protein
MKLKITKWAVYVARMEIREAFTGFWWGHLRERDHLGDSSADGRIILKRIFKKGYLGVWIESCWLKIGTYGGHLRMK